jgi:hypothetical protein
MKTKNLLIAGLLSFLFFLSCDDDKDEVNASIVGTWSGNKADFKLNPDGIIPAFTVSEDNFPVMLEFKNDGVLILTDDAQSTTGTYQLNGKKLTININYEFEFIGLSGIFDVEELTRAKLRASREEEGTYEHPDTRQKFDGKVKAFLYFDRQEN